MVKSVIYTAVAIILCVGFFIWTEIYLQRQFEDVHAAFETLYDKIETKSATREDAYAVKSLWTEKKKILHVFVPHNDVSYIDYWLNEACALIYKDKYDLALGKLEVLLEITEALPDAYTLKFENVF